MKNNKRGFEKVSYTEFNRAFANFVEPTSALYDQIAMPSRQTSGSCGYDIRTIFGFSLAPGASIVVPTGIKAYFASDEFLAIYNRSSMGIKKNIALKNQVGIIDSDYYNNVSNEGHLFVGLYNFGNDTWVVKPGEAIAQCIFQKYLLASDDATNDNYIQRLGGIGSTNHEN